MSGPGDDGRPCGTGPGVDVLLVGAVSVLGGGANAAWDQADGGPCPPPPPRPPAAALPALRLQGNGIGVTRFGDAFDPTVDAIGGCGGVGGRTATWW